MKKAGIIINSNKPGVYEYLCEVIGVFAKNNAMPVITVADYEKAARSGAAYVNLKNAKANGTLETVSESELFSIPDFLIVLGGDGTILAAAEKAAQAGIPVLGINLGTLGYLTDADISEGFASIEKVLNGEYKIEKRMTLTASFVIENGRENKGGKPPSAQSEFCENKSATQPHVFNEFSANQTAKQPLALNEFCVSKGVLSRMITFSLSVNGSYINTYRADGIICATPTGSTAYNLSAGGPLLSPWSDMIAITPICPHDLFARPTVVSGTDVITIKIISGGDGEIVLSADGRHAAKLTHGSEVLIKASEYYMSIIKTNDLSFFDVLRKKMPIYL
ncbi:MAG: NAD(+)/NADH kinase [Clostridiales bacterium]|jgi:NAD+ kinase|nr:NAD(+)/NADH kinase [Clostridiales bacterium]